MKKILMMALVAVMTVPVFAQSEMDDPVYVSSDGKVMFDIMAHLGHGYHITSSNDFDPNYCSEFFINFLKFGVYPASWLGVELSADFNVNNFNSKTSFFERGDKRLIQAVSLPTDVGAMEKTRGGFNVYSVNAPLLVKGIFGDFQVGVGAQASWNFTADTYYRYRVGDRWTEVTERKAKANPFTYGIVALVSYDGLGIYFKYYPKALLPAGSVDLSFMTVGVAISL